MRVGAKIAIAVLAGAGAGAVSHIAYNKDGGLGSTQSIAATGVLLLGMLGAAGTTSRPGVTLGIGVAAIVAARLGVVALGSRQSSGSPTSTDAPPSATTTTTSVPETKSPAPEPYPNYPPGPDHSEAPTTIGSLPDPPSTDSTTTTSTTSTTTSTTLPPTGERPERGDAAKIIAAVPISGPTPELEKKVREALELLISTPTGRAIVEAVPWEMTDITVYDDETYKKDINEFGAAQASSNGPVSVSAGVTADLIGLADVLAHELTHLADMRGHPEALSYGETQAEHDRWNLWTETRAYMVDAKVATELGEPRRSYGNLDEVPRTWDSMATTIRDMYPSIVDKTTLPADLESLVMGAGDPDITRILGGTPVEADS